MMEAQCPVVKNCCQLDTGHIMSDPALEIDRRFRFRSKRFGVYGRVTGLIINPDEAV